MSKGNTQRLEHFTGNRDRHRIELYGEEDRKAEIARKRAAAQRQRYRRWSWACAYIGASVVCLLMLEWTPEGFMWTRPDVEVNHDYRDAALYQYYYRITDPLPGEKLRGAERLLFSIGLLLLMPVYLLLTTVITLLHVLSFTTKLPLVEVLQSPSAETFLTLRFAVAWGLTFWGVYKLNQYWHGLVLLFFSVLCGFGIAVFVWGVLQLYEIYPVVPLEQYLLAEWQYVPDKSLDKPFRAVLILLCVALVMLFNRRTFTPPKAQPRGT